MTRIAIRTRSAALLVIVGLGLSTSGCSKDKPGPFTAPIAGSAVQIGVPPSGERPQADRSFGFGDLGTIGLPDGTILSHRADTTCLTEFRPAAEPQPVRCLGVKPSNAGPVGFARTPDGKVYLNWGTPLYAGTPPEFKDLTGVSGPSYPVMRDGMPVGVRSDGTLIVIGQGQVWEFHQGALTPISRIADLHWPRPEPQPVYRSAGTCGFVDAGDTVWLAPDRGDPIQPVRPQSLLADVVGITKSGAAVWPKLPTAVAGVPGDVTAMEVLGMVSDGAGGFYFRVAKVDTTPQYAIHVALDGRGELIAASDVDPEDQAARDVRMSGPGDALHIPLYLPKGMVVRPGALILVGGANYAIAVGLPKS